MKKFLFITIILIALFIIQNFVRSIVGVWQKESLIDHAKVELAKQKKENEVLRKQYQQVKKPSFVEEQARNKLLMVKDNEQQIVIPKSLLKDRSQKTASVDNKPVWQQWVSLFF